ncbi:hypothetical protein [Streptosporangium sp. G12]
MPETTLTFPEGAVSVAEIVAREYASHEDHTRHRFAKDLVEMFLGLRSVAAAAEDRKSVDLIESIARITLSLAGLKPEEAGMTPDTGCSRTSPDGLGCCRTVPDETGQSGTISNAAERFGTIRNAGQPRTEAAR